MKTAHVATAARPAITSTVGALSDRELLRETSNLVRHERHLQGAIIDHLAEIEARGLYLERGFSSLFDYAVRELGYSDAAAARRIGAMRLCADQADAREGLRNGSLTLSAAAELQWAFDRQRRRGSISRAAAIAPVGSAAQNDPAAVELTRFRGHIESEHERRDLPWRERIKRTHLSSASRWSSWCSLGGRRTNWLGSTRLQPGPSATGWPRVSATQDSATTV